MRKRKRGPRGNAHHVRNFGLELARAKPKSEVMERRTRVEVYARSGNKNLKQVSKHKTGSLASRRGSAVLAVEQIAHGPSASLVRFAHALALVGIHAALGYGSSIVVLATLGAAVGEARFVGLQLEFFPADGADFDRESHASFL